MHTIVELRELFQQHKIIIEESFGWYLICNGDKWTMLDDVYYLNDSPVTKKDIIAYAKKGAIMRPKKIIPKHGLEEDIVDVDAGTFIFSR